MRTTLLLLTLALGLAACDGPYRPGRTGQLPILNQNLPSNGQPYSRGSLPP